MFWSAFLLASKLEALLLPIKTIFIFLMFYPFIHLEFILVYKFAFKYFCSNNSYEKAVYFCLPRWNSKIYHMELVMVPSTTIHLKILTFIHLHIRVLELEKKISLSHVKSQVIAKDDSYLLNKMCQHFFLVNIFWISFLLNVIFMWTTIPLAFVKLHRNASCWTYLQ